MEQKLPNSAKQTIKFFEDFVRKESTVSFILEVRRKLGLPQQGLSYEDFDRDLLSQEPVGFIGYIPWRLSDNAERRRELLGILISNVFGFLSAKNIDSSFIASMLRNYILFNQVISDFPTQDMTTDFIKMENLREFVRRYDRNNPQAWRPLDREETTDEETRQAELNESLHKSLKNTSEKYPIAIYINPNSSQRQIVDFISTYWDWIQKQRNGDLKNFTKVRSRNKQVRNDFVYKNRHLPIKKITKLVQENFGEFLDEGNIGKIISQETKKRN